METYQITAVRNAFSHDEHLRTGIRHVNIANELWIAKLSYDTGLEVEFIKKNLDIIKEL